MKVVDKITRIVTLTLTHEEAEWLRLQMSEHTTLPLTSDFDITIKEKFRDVLNLDRNKILSQFPMRPPSPAKRIVPTSSQREPLI